MGVIVSILNYLILKKYITGEGASDVLKADVPFDHPENY
jgi:hypothetical protein